MAVTTDTDFLKGGRLIVHSHPVITNCPQLLGSVLIDDFVYESFPSGVVYEYSNQKVFALTYNLYVPIDAGSDAYYKIHVMDVSEDENPTVIFDSAELDWSNWSNVTFLQTGNLYHTTTKEFFVPTAMFIDETNEKIYVAGRFEHYESTNIGEGPSDDFNTAWAYPCLRTFDLSTSPGEIGSGTLGSLVNSDYQIGINHMFMVGSDPYFVCRFASDFYDDETVILDIGLEIVTSLGDVSITLIAEQLLLGNDTSFNFVVFDASTPSSPDGPGVLERPFSAQYAENGRAWGNIQEDPELLACVSIENPGTPTLLGDSEPATVPGITGKIDLRLVGSTGSDFVYISKTNSPSVVKVCEEAAPGIVRNKRMYDVRTDFDSESETFNSLFLDVYGG